jgi:hypothetical protein
MISASEFSAIAALDLDPIKVKLMHEESGEGWSLAYANEVEFEYRRFLYLMKKYPSERAAPLFDVDIFWHYHILDTMKYAADCEHIFGYFLHHFPYVGLRGADDEAAHHHVGVRMQELYEATFNEAYIRTEQDQHKTAYSTATAKTAYSTAIAKTAYSTAIAKTAYSTAIAKTAYSTAIAKTAYSTAIAKTAYSTAIIEAGAAVPASAWSTTNREAAPQFDRFYSERPSLAKVA